MRRTRKSFSAPRWLAPAGVLAVVAVIAFFAGRAVGRSQGRSLPGSAGGVMQRSAPLPPLVIRLADGQALEIAARTYWHRAFQLPEPARECLLTGRVVGISGGDKDFEALLLSDDAYQNWSTDHDFRAEWQSGVVTVVTIERKLRAPGSFHFVVSNRFSLLTPKAVTISAGVSCPGG